MKDASAGRHSSSFRDPAGYVFSSKGQLYRQINKAGQVDFEHFLDSGLYKALADDDLIIAHREISKNIGLPVDDKRYKIIQPELIPFNSYPYEWSFSQLKAAGLLTLKLQQKALARGMILKDASAYNVQFIGKRPIFIDSLSFKIHQPGDAWDGYKQYCEHFIAPLALASYSSLEVLRLLRIYLDGLPLQLTTSLLPGRAKFRRGLSSHLYLHAASLRRYEAEGSKRPKKTNVRPLALNGLIASLERTTSKLQPPTQKTQWGQYYENTNYSPAAFAAKKEIVSKFLTSISPKTKLVWDLGANDGTFSQLAAAGAYTISFDIDPLAVERNFNQPDERSEKNTILPLVQDLTNPSPGLGWAHAERASLQARGPADVALALALVHHLAIGNNLPFSDIAAFLAKLARNLIIEFIPKEDSKVQFLLRSRNNIFAEYDQKHFEQAFNQHFKLVEKQPIKDSLRTLYLFKAKA